MPIFHQRVTIAAGATSQNLLAGDDVEFPPAPSSVVAGFRAEAAAAGDLQYAFQIGTRVITRQGSVGVESGVGIGVRPLEDLEIRDVALGGNRIQVYITNTDAVNPLDLDVYVATDVL